MKKKKKNNVETGLCEWGTETNKIREFICVCMNKKKKEKRMGNRSKNVDIRNVLILKRWRKMMEKFQFIKFLGNSNVFVMFY